MSCTYIYTPPHVASIHNHFHRSRYKWRAKKNVTLLKDVKPHKTGGEIKTTQVEEKKKAKQERGEEAGAR